MENEKFRHEFKYLISQNQVELLKARMSGILRRDAHVAANGMYTITSLYFDDYENRCYYENLSGVDPREKFRIRIYNHDASRISLECKRKERGKTLKTACLITAEECRDLMHGIVKNDPNAPPVKNRFQNEIRLRGMHPAVIVEYERIPYVYPAGNVRITLDMNLSSSPETEHFLTGTAARRPVMPTGMQLLEVKYDEFLPDHIYRALQLDDLRQTAYSKYYLCREYSLR